MEIAVETGTRWADKAHEVLSFRCVSSPSSLVFAHSTMASRRKNVKKGVQFTIMVVGKQPPSVISLLHSKHCHLGASGTGRTTFVNTLCESEILPHKVCDNPETAHIEEGIRIKPVTVGEYHDVTAC